MKRAGKRRGAQLGESKYNYTKVSRNTETESRGNRRVSLKLESCFETARLPCRLQPRHRRALPFPNSARPLVPSRPPTFVPRWSRERLKQKETFPRRLQTIVKENLCNTSCNGVQRFLRLRTLPNTFITNVIGTMYLNWSSEIESPSSIHSFRKRVQRFKQIILL